MKYRIPKGKPIYDKDMRFIMYSLKEVTYTEQELEVDWQATGRTMMFKLPPGTRTPLNDRYIGCIVVFTNDVQKIITDEI